MRVALVLALAAIALTPAAARESEGETDRIPRSRIPEAARPHPQKSASFFAGGASML